MDIYTIYRIHNGFMHFVKFCSNTKSKTSLLSLLQCIQNFKNEQYKSMTQSATFQFAQKGNMEELVIHGSFRYFEDKNIVFSVF